MTQIISQTFRVRTGTEGPSHDPYSYEEYILCRNGVVTKLHLGLAEFCRGEENGEEFFIKGKGAMDKWESITNIPVKSLNRLDNRLNGMPQRCPYCFNSSSNYVVHGGYVGESIFTCPKCDNVVWEEAVTEAMIR